MYRQVRNALAHRRERELPHHADRARYHLAFAEAGKPDAEIERVSHRDILARLTCVGARERQLLSINSALEQKKLQLNQFMSESDGRSNIRKRYRSEGRGDGDAEAD
jgi:hypothetical protein